MLDHLENVKLSEPSEPSFKVSTKDKQLNLFDIGAS